MYPLSPTLDSVGPLTRTARDAAIVYQAIQGADPADRTTAGQEPHDVLGLIDHGVAGMRLAFVETMFFDGADDHVAAAVRGNTRRLRAPRRRGGLDRTARGRRG